LYFTPSTLVKKVPRTAMDSIPLPVVMVSPRDPNFFRGSNKLMSYVSNHTEIRPVYVSLSRKGDLYIRLANSSDCETVLAHPHWSSIGCARLGRKRSAAQKRRIVCSNLDRDLDASQISHLIQDRLDYAVKSVRVFSRRGRPTGRAVVEFESPDDRVRALEHREFGDPRSHRIVVIEDFFSSSKHAQCYQCFGFGHMQTQCRESPICNQCGNHPHSGNCPRRRPCAHCNTSHRPGASTCPELRKHQSLRASEISEFRSRRDRSLDIPDNRNPPPRRSNSASYAAVANPQNKLLQRAEVESRNLKSVLDSAARMIDASKPEEAAEKIQTALKLLHEISRTLTTCSARTSDEADVPRRPPHHAPRRIPRVSRTVSRPPVRLLRRSVHRVSRPASRPPVRILRRSVPPRTLQSPAAPSSRSVQPPTPARVSLSPRPTPPLVHNPRFAVAPEVTHSQELKHDTLSDPPSDLPSDSLGTPISRGPKRKRPEKKRGGTKPSRPTSTAPPSKHSGLTSTALPSPLPPANHSECTTRNPKIHPSASFLSITPPPIGPQTTPVSSDDCSESPHEKKRPRHDLLLHADAAELASKAARHRPVTRSSSQSVDTLIQSPSDSSRSDPKTHPRAQVDSESSSPDSQPETEESIPSRATREMSESQLPSASTSTNSDVNVSGH